MSYIVELVDVGGYVGSSVDDAPKQAYGHRPSRATVLPQQVGQVEQVCLAR